MTPFKTGFPVTGVIFLGMIGAIPTLLSVFLMTGLFSQKDSGKDEKLGASDLSIFTRVCAELIKIGK